MSHSFALICDRVKEVILEAVDQCWVTVHFLTKEVSILDLLPKKDLSEQNLGTTRLFVLF